MLKKCLLSIFIIILSMFLVSCDKGSKPAIIDDSNNDNDIVITKKEIKLKRSGLRYDILTQLPLSLRDYVSGESTFSDKLLTNISRENINYKNTLAANEIFNQYEEASLIYEEIEKLFNNIISDLSFYNDKTINDSNLSIPVDVNLKKLKYNDFLILTDINIEITGKGENIDFDVYNFIGDFTLKIDISTNEDNIIKTCINLMLNDVNFRDNEINGFNISFIEKDFMDIKFVDNKDDIKETNTLYLINNTEGTNIVNTKTSISNSKDIKFLNKDKYLFYGDDKDGTILNQINHKEYTISNNLETVIKHLKYNDLEIFDSTHGLLYKGLTGYNEYLRNEQLIKDEVSFIGYPINIFSDWNDISISNNDISFNDLGYNSNQLKQTQISFITYNGIVTDNASLGFQYLNTSIYGEDNHYILGYFANSNNQLDDLYNFILNYDYEQFPKIKISEDIKCKIESKIRYIYRFYLEQNGIKFDYQSLPVIYDVQKEFNLNELNLKLEMGYDRYQTYVLNLIQNDEVKDFYRIDGLSINITNIKKEGNLCIAYGQKENKPYILVFEINNDGHFVENSLKEYSYRRYGEMINVSYDINAKEFNAHMSFDNGFEETIKIMDNYFMLPFINEHIQLNYSKDKVIEPKYIVIHETANHNIGADGYMHYRYWNTNANANASTHFVVDDTSVWQLLNLNEYAWHVGDNRQRDDGSYYSDIHNSNTIGIEICVNDDGNYMEARQKAIYLTVILLEELDLTPNDVVRHMDASGKTCPAIMIRYPNLWDDFLDQVTNIYEERHIK